MCGIQGGSYAQLTLRAMLETKKAIKEVSDVIKAGALGPEIVVNMADRSGGYFNLQNQDGQSDVDLIGKITNGKEGQYRVFAQEKNTRLREMHQLAGHVLSWQSRNPAIDKWGGAIFVPADQGREFYLAFSGLPELGDETMMLLVAVRTDLLSLRKAREYAEISDNRLFLNHKWAI